MTKNLDGRNYGEGTFNKFGGKESSMCTNEKTGVKPRHGISYTVSHEICHLKPIGTCITTSFF